MNANLPNTPTEWVDADDAPELTDADFSRPDLVWKIGGAVVNKAAGKRAFSAAMKKQKVNIALDPDVVAWFKQEAGGRGYQTLINATLREAMRQKTLEDLLRQVIREELHPV
jgi:uncharacterized protein (DUF4415 family)